ncbi:hypothetical protein C3L33_00812, partial [Rhododendron williamsianum]
MRKIMKAVHEPDPPARPPVPTRKQTPWTVLISLFGRVRQKKPPNFPNPTPFVRREFTPPDLHFSSSPLLPTSTSPSPTVHPHSSVVVFVLNGYGGGSTSSSTTSSPQSFPAVDAPLDQGPPSLSQPPMYTSPDSSSAGCHLLLCL